MSLDWRKLHGEFFRDARVLVTGGAGFIGSHLVDVLATLGARVVVLDDLSGSDGANLSDSRSKIELIQESVLNESALRSAIAGCRFVFHQAARVSVPGSIADPKSYELTNTAGTFYVLEAARQARVARVMFAASSAAYGDGESLPKVETMPVLPKSPYAANKVAGEALVRAYAQCYEIDAVSLRYFNIFGPRQNANSAYAGVIAAFAKKLAANEPPIIYGNGSQSRDFTFVHNAVHANLLAARCEKPLGGEVINVACGERIDLNMLATMMSEMFGRRALKAQHAPERAGDIKHSQADLSRARKVLGYEPVIDFRDGLARTVEWYRQRG